MIPAFPTCCFPLRLSPSGKSDGPEVFLRTSPDWVRDSAPRSAAHSSPAHGSSKSFTSRILKDPCSQKDSLSEVGDDPDGLPPVDGIPVGRSLGSVCIALALHLTCPSVSNPCNDLWTTHQIHVSGLSARVKGPYPPGYVFPSPLGWRHSLLGSSCARYGIGPSFRRLLGLLEWPPDRNGVAAFRISEERSGRMLPVLRGQGVRSQDVKLLGSGQGGSPGVVTRYRRNHLFQRLVITEPRRQFTCVHPSDLPLARRRWDGSNLPWVSPLCCRMLRYLALAGVGDRSGH
jgi:hypothetical protein